MLSKRSAFRVILNCANKLLLYCWDTGEGLLDKHRLINVIRTHLVAALYTFYHIDARQLHVTWWCCEHISMFLYRGVCYILVRMYPSRTPVHKSRVAHCGLSTISPSRAKNKIHEHKLFFKYIVHFLFNFTSFIENWLSINKHVHANPVGSGFHDGYRYAESASITPTVFKIWRHVYITKELEHHQTKFKGQLSGTSNKQYHDQLPIVTSYV